MCWGGYLAKFPLGEFDQECGHKETCIKELDAKGECVGMRNCGLRQVVFRVSRDRSIAALPQELCEVTKEIEEKALEIYRSKGGRKGMGQMIENKIKSYLNSLKGVGILEVSQATRKQVEKKLGLKPDIMLGPKGVETAIEVCAWWDSNKFRSAAMQGLMLKKEYPQIKYFILIFSHLPNDELTPSRKVHLEFAKGLRAIHGVYGFVQLPELIQIISSSSRLADA